MKNRIKVTINGQVCSGTSGQTILDIAEKNGIHIPNLCHNEEVKVYGACSLCVVEGEGMPKLMSDVLVSRLHSVKLLVVVLSLFAGIISAFVDNVATVLMVAPVAIALCKDLKISPVPAIVCI